jgi:hypothetical protein
MNHTLKTIADETGESKDTIRKRYSRAKAKHGELGSIVKGVRTFTDDERKILDSFAAEPKNKPEPKATMDVVSDPAHGASLTPAMGKMRFNPAALLNCTNSTADTVESLDQLSAFAIAMGQGVEQVSAKNRHEYEQVADAAKAALNQLQALKLKISEARAVSTMVEIHKRQAIKDGIEAQSEIESMMQGS